MTYDFAYEGSVSFQARPVVRHCDLLDGAEADCYGIVTVEPTRAPEGCAGAGWFIYRIARGKNEITGYRQGSRAAVHAEVNMLVDGLNGRRHLSDGAPTASSRRSGNGRGRRVELTL